MLPDEYFDASCGRFAKNCGLSTGHPYHPPRIQHFHLLEVVVPKERRLDPSVIPIYSLVRIGIPIMESDNLQLGSIGLYNYISLSSTTGSQLNTAKKYPSSFSSTTTIITVTICHFFRHLQERHGSSRTCENRKWTVYFLTPNTFSAGA